MEHQMEPKKFTYINISADSVTRALRLTIGEKILKKLNDKGIGLHKLKDGSNSDDDDLIELAKIVEEEEQEMCEKCEV